MARTSRKNKSSTASAIRILREALAALELQEEREPIVPDVPPPVPVIHHQDHLGNKLLIGDFVSYRPNPACTDTLIGIIVSATPRRIYIRDTNRPNSTPVIRSPNSVYLAR